MSRATGAKALAVLVAVGAHAAVITTFLQPQAAQLEGTGGVADVRLGTSFQDLVQGALVSAQRPTVEPAEQLNTPTAQPVVAPTSVAHAQPESPLRPEAMTAAVAPPSTVRSASQAAEAPPAQLRPTVAAAAPTQVVATQPAPTTATVSTQQVQRAAPPRQADVAPVAMQAETASVEPLSPAAAAQSQTPEDIAPIDARVTVSPDRSLRPVARPDRAERRDPPRQEQPRPTTSTASNTGNAARSETSGTAQGQRNASATTQGTGRTQQATGTADVSNYPGKVMQCIARAGRPRVNARGTAVVSFRITGNGRVSGVALAASSGNARLDKAAVQTIRRAGPCPSPPRGARTAFSIRVQARS